MLINEIIKQEYISNYVHPDVDKTIDKFERRAKKRVKARSKMGFHPGFRMGYPFRVKEDWSKKYKKTINCANPKGFSQKAHCAGKKKKK